MGMGYIAKGNNFYDFLFASLENEVLPKGLYF